MATKADIKQALYDELRTVLTNYANSNPDFTVSSPDTHVDTLDNYDSDSATPFLGFEVFGRPLNRGIDGNVHVNDVVYTDGTIDYVQYERDTRLTVEIGIVDDDEKLKDNLYTATVDQFSGYIGCSSYDALHSDIDRLRDGGFDDQSRPDDNVHGDRQSYTLDYCRYFRVDDFVPVTSISVTIEDLDEDYVYGSDTIVN